MKGTIKFIDLFAGIGGTRCGLGFPCQSFSGGGKRLGFTETRGTLFFDVERILKKKEPAGFILENVEGLVSFILTNLATKDENH